jgi:hypothetical protein
VDQLWGYRRRGWIDKGRSERAMSSAVKRSAVMVLLGLLALGDLLGLGISANLNGQRPRRGRVIQVSPRCSMTSASGPDSRRPFAAFRERNTPRPMVGIMSSPRPVSGRLAVIVACHR